MPFDQIVSTKLISSRRLPLIELSDDSQSFIFIKFFHKEFLFVLYKGFRAFIILSMTDLFNSIFRMKAATNTQGMAQLTFMGSLF